MISLVGMGERMARWGYLLEFALRAKLTATGVAAAASRC
jgi:hypothetical protein